MVMRTREAKLKRVRKFILDDSEDRERYEKIINDPQYNIIREEFAYDKLGRAIITIWYEEED